ncbi:hypothetical protein N431DRAFT_458234 [Stipitochalara longipes BDJ]|nr:hypothetical protein N431DRAFT_458234 [Stipitochalara longipes BDJ]
MDGLERSVVEQNDGEVPAWIGARLRLVHQVAFCSMVWRRLGGGGYSSGYTQRANVYGSVAGCWCAPRCLSLLPAQGLRFHFHFRLHARPLLPGGAVLPPRTVLLLLVREHFPVEIGTNITDALRYESRFSHGSLSSSQLSCSAVLRSACPALPCPALPYSTYNTPGSADAILDSLPHCLVAFYASPEAAASS